MSKQTPRGWMFTLGLASLAILGALVARATSIGETEEAHTIEADSCFRYGRLECCVKDD